jgi:hypothetical protein
MVHLLIYVVTQIIDLGPVFLDNMFLYESLNGIIKRYVHNRSHLDGSIILCFLTEECISFCNDYMEVYVPVGQPINKHIRRLDGVCHKHGKRDLHVELNKPNRRHDYDRAHTVALHHLQVVTPFAMTHMRKLKQRYVHLGQKSVEQQITREHNPTLRLGSKSTFKIIHCQSMMIE